MADRIWILGAADPEMQAIEQILRECGETVVYATLNGERVGGASAYSPAARAETLMWIRAECDLDRLHVYTVETTCGPDSAIRIDHHRPGDPGFGAPSDEFLRASSLGQVIAELARLEVLPEAWGTGPNLLVEPGAFERISAEDLISPEDAEVGWYVGAYDGFCDATSGYLIPVQLILTAAADHCLGAAYAGKCPGVDPDGLMRWRVEQRAKFQGRDAGALLADVATAKTALESAPKLELSHSPGNHCGGSQCGCREGGYGYGGSTRVGTGDCYCECDGCHDGDHVVLVSDVRGVHIPELPEAGTRYGIPYVADGLPGPDGRVKIVCSGSAEVVRAFFGWAKCEGLVDAYGDPERGFAGAYRAI